MIKGERTNVYQVYDRLANWFLANRSVELLEKNYLDNLIEHLPIGGTILDLGCGTGKPILGYLLSRGFQVTGIDASKAMLEIAKVSFPSTELILQDMRLLSIDKRFDAIIAWHSLFHLPATDQTAMFKTFEKYLNANGVLLFTSGTEHVEIWGLNVDVSLFHASLDIQEYAQLLKEHHFKFLKHVANDPDCGYATVWLAQKNMG